LTQITDHSLDEGDSDGRDRCEDSGMEVGLPDKCTLGDERLIDMSPKSCAAAPEGRPFQDLGPATEIQLTTPRPSAYSSSACCLEYSFHRVSAHGTGSILQQPLSDAAPNVDSPLHRHLKGDVARLVGIAHLSAALAPIRLAPKPLYAPKPLHAPNVPGPRARLAPNTLPPGANPRCKPSPMALEALMGYVCKTLELDAVDFYVQDAGSADLCGRPEPGPRCIPPFRTQSYAPGGSRAIDELNWCRITLASPLIKKVIATRQPVWFGRAAQQQAALQHTTARGLNIVAVPCPCSASDVHAADAEAGTLPPDSISAVLLLYATRPIIRTAPFRRLVRVLGLTIASLVDVNERLGPAPLSSSFTLHPHAAESAAAGWLLLVASRALHADVSEQWMARELEPGRIELHADRILVGKCVTQEGITTVTGPRSEQCHPISSPMCHAAFLSDAPIWHDYNQHSAEPTIEASAATAHGDVSTAVSMTMLRCASARENDASTPHQACIFVFFSKRRVEELQMASVLLTHLQELLDCAMAVAHAKALLHAAVAALPKPVPPPSYEVDRCPPHKFMRTALAVTVPDSTDAYKTQDAGGRDSTQSTTPFEDEIQDASGRDSTHSDTNKLGYDVASGIRKSRRARRASRKLADFPPVRSLRDAQLTWMPEAAPPQKQRRLQIDSSGGSAPPCGRWSAQDSHQAPSSRLLQAQSLPPSTASPGLAPMPRPSANDAYLSSPIWSTARCSENSEQEDALDRLLDSCLL
jgi:hypothetical protein